MSDSNKKPLINQYLEALEELQQHVFNENLNPFYVFRGQSIIHSVVQPTSNRMKKFKPSDEIDGDDVDFLIAHDKNLINDARMKGHDILNGARKLKDLEVLADQRHYGHPTSFMDCSFNFFTALWFACDSKSEDTKDHDGEIITFDVGDLSKFSQINHDMIEKNGLEQFFKHALRDKSESRSPLEIDPILHYHPLSYWIPEGFNNRFRDQDCVFLFGDPFIKKTHSARSKKDIKVELKSPFITENFTIKIKKEHKKEIKKELKRFFWLRCKLFI